MMMMQRAAVLTARHATRRTIITARPYHGSFIAEKAKSSFDLPDPRKEMSYNDSMSYGPLNKNNHSESGSLESTSSKPHNTNAANMQSVSFSTDASNNNDTTATTTTTSPVRKWSPQLTKIVATIGPTSEQLPVLQDVVRCGMRVMRLNFSHATVEEVELRIQNLKLSPGRHKAAAVSKNFLEDIEEQNVRAVLLDTRGPEIRSGKLKDDDSGHETISLKAGNKIALRTTSDWQQHGSTETDLFIDYPSLHKSLASGSKVLLDDGAVTLTVDSVDESNIVCTIDNTGELRSRAGVNLPGAETDLPAMSEKDKVDIKYGMTKDVDYVAASFIQSAQGVHEIRQYMADCAKELGWDDEHPLPLLISKIESVAGLNRFDEILEASDGIMCARGDLGVEIPIQQVTNAQKEMVAACNAAGKPVIVATQMLESMAKNPRPTRAEVADVTNAVYDGADAVMLSGETAKGKYPVESVKMMNEIICSAEQYSRTGGMGSPTPHAVEFVGDGSSLSALAKAAVTAAEERNAAAILVVTHHGVLARLVSAYRPNVPIVTFCPTTKVARQLILYRGIHPVVGLNGIVPDKKSVVAVQDAKAMGFVETGDDVVVLMMEKNNDLGSFVTMKVATIP